MDDKEGEFLLMDRIQKIQQIVGKYGEEKFYLSFSGGKDSTILHYLLDMAIPQNMIPRVYANTGIEYSAIVKFVTDLSETDPRIVIIKPTVNIKRVLEEKGYPFKSKVHSRKLEAFQKHGMTQTVKAYLGLDESKNYSSANLCPKKLKYQFDKAFELKVSKKCCEEMKEKPLKTWAKSNGKRYAILGLRADEGGGRRNAVCVSMAGKELKSFQPLASVSDEWESWFVGKYNVKLCKLYYEPFLFKRTGCKGCPYNIDVQNDIDTLQKYFPNERKQCEIIWKPVYDEYRRIGYRLKPWNEQLDLFDEIGG